LSSLLFNLAIASCKISLDVQTSSLDTQVQTLGTDAKSIVLLTSGLLSVSKFKVSFGLASSVPKEKESVSSGLLSVSGFNSGDKSKALFVSGEREKALLSEFSTGFLSSSTISSGARFSEDKSKLLFDVSKDSFTIGISSETSDTGLSVSQTKGVLACSVPVSSDRISKSSSLFVVLIFIKLVLNTNNIISYKKNKCKNLIILIYFI
jgi:hypothetical protein